MLAAYHDQEWGVPVHDSRRLFEALTLDIFQAGLSWRTILSKRENFRQAFDGFEPSIIADYDDRQLDRLLQDSGIVRNRKKVEATIHNARQYLELEVTAGGFADFLWAVTGGETIKGPAAAELGELPSQSAQSTAMAAALKARGFRFVGPTICYAFMQAVGMVDDHLIGCFKFSGRP